MLVHPVVIPGWGTRSWTVLGDDDVPVAPVDRFLAYLTDIGRSPNTVKAYAHDMKDLWQFLRFRGLDWREARLEDIAEFVVWLQLPAAGRAGEVAVLPSSVPEVSVTTVNRKLAAVSSFYAHQARNDEGPGDLLAAWRTGGRGGWKPFLHHVSRGKPYRGRAITLKAPKKLPRVLTVAETQAVLDSCTRLGPLLLRPDARDGHVFLGCKTDMQSIFLFWLFKPLVSVPLERNRCGGTAGVRPCPAWQLAVPARQIPGVQWR